MKKVFCFFLSVVLTMFLAACTQLDEVDNLQSNGSDISSTENSSDIGSTEKDPSSSPEFEQVENVSSLYRLVMQDGTFVVIDKSTETLLTYDKNEKAFVKIASVTDAAQLFQTGENTVLIPGDNRTYVNINTGEATSDFYGTLFAGEEKVEYKEESNVYSARATEFAVKEYGEHDLYTYPYSLLDYGECSNSEIIASRYFIGLYVKETLVEDGSLYMYPTYIVAYDYQTGSLADGIYIGDKGFDTYKMIKCTMGNYVCVDGDLFDVSKVFDNEYEPQELHTMYESFRCMGNTAYYINSGNSICSVSQAGEVTALYTWTEDDREISSYYVTESGKIPFVVTENYFEKENGTLYMGDVCVYEDADEILYADDDSIIISVNGKMKLLPMP